MIARILSLFRDNLPRPLDLSGASDGYGGAWDALPTSNAATGAAYLGPGAMPDFSGLKETGKCQ